MTKRAFATTRGQVWLFGEPSAFEGDAPVVLALSGAFAPADAFDRLPVAMPEAAVLRGHMPGNHCPLLDRQDVEAYAEAYGEALAQIGRPAIVCGSSLGALVAMAMGGAEVRGCVALDPPLRSESFTALVAPFRLRLAAQPNNAALQGFLWSVFGVAAEETTARDYMPLLETLTTPTTVIVGQRSGEAPSLVGETERAMLGDHPGVRLLYSRRGGHNLVYEEGALVLGALRDLLQLTA